MDPLARSVTVSIVDNSISGALLPVNEYDFGISRIKIKTYLKYKNSSKEERNDMR